jgi:predicted MFS family arabinose efflux permease
MDKKVTTTKKLAVAVLSLSLLTVMAGAAVAPALGVIEEHFSGDSRMLVQMIISVPAIFIALTNMVFARMCRHVKSRTLVLIGLALYTAGGCAAGLFNSIYAVLAARALVGIGVGIIMPMSTGLISFYFQAGEQQRYMGFSSAMNQLGGVIATLLSGFLAAISWRYSFLVYLMGLISIVLCLLFLPNHRISQDESRLSGAAFRSYCPYIVMMFLLMSVFFIYPANFAVETVGTGVVPQQYIAVIMAAMDLIAFGGGLSFVFVYRKFRSGTRLVSPLLFFTGYVLLIFAGNWEFTVLGSFFIGFANGLGVPYIISAAARRAGQNAATTVMPLISMALYLAQFLSPALMSAVNLAFGGTGVQHLPYVAAAVIAALYFIWSGTMIKENNPR